MANDGTLNFDTKIDSSGFEKGLSTIGGAAQKGLNVTTKVLGGAATAVTALGGAAIKVGSDFEAGMSQVQAITGTVSDKDLPGIVAKAEEMGLSFEKGANTTETAMNILSAKAKEMGASTKFSATESAEALTYMAMAGWKTEDMMGGIEGVMNLAAASGEDLATTSDIVTDALTAFGMTAADSTHFADILAAASSNANTNVGLMGETFKYVAPLAGALGYSAEDTATAIGLMANAGIKGSQAGTALRSIMTRMAKPTKESAMAMEALGLSVTDSSGKMKPLSEVVGDMRAGFSGLTEDEKASYAAMLGGQEAMSGLLAIVSASDEDFEKLSGAINDCNGSAEEMAEIMQDNLQGQLVILQPGLDILGVSLYETMQDTAKDVVKEAQEMVRQLQDAFNEGGFNGLVSSFGNVLAQIVQRTAEAAPMMIDAAVKLVISFCDGLKNASGIGESGASLITSLITGVLSCVGELWSTAVVIIAELLSGMAQELPQILETGKEAVSQFGQSLVENAPSILSSAVTIISTLFNGLMSALPQIADAGAGVLNRLAEGIASNLPAMTPAAMQSLMEFSGSLRKNAGQLVDAGLNLIRALAQSLIDNLPVFIETIPTIITNIAGLINDNAPKLLMCGIELIGKLAMGILKSIPTLVTNIPQIIQAIVSVILAFNWIELGGSIIRGLVNGIKSLASAIPTAFREFCANAHGIVSNFGWSGLGKAIIQLLKNGVSSLAGLIPQSLGGIATTALNAIKNMDWWGLGVNIIRGFASGIAGSAGELLKAATEMASGLLDSVKSFFGIHSPSTVMQEQGGFLVQGLINGIANMPAELAQYLDQTVQKIIAWGQQMLSNVQSIVQKVVNTAVNLIAQLPGKVWIWLTNVVTRTVQWGQQMLITATTAISNMISSIISLLSQLPGKVWTWLVNVVTKVTAWGQQMLNTAKSAISTMISAVVSLLSELPGKVWTWLVNTVTKVTQWGQQMLNTAKTAISNMIAAVISLFSELPGKVWTWLVNTVAKVTAWGQQMLSSAKTAITNMVSGVISVLSELPGKVAAQLSSVVSKVSAWSHDLASKGASAAKGLYNAVVEGVSGLPSKMKEVGKNIVDGIWNGISSGWDWLKNKVSSVAKSLLDSAKSALGVNSPSKAFRDEFGRWLMPGTVEGVKRSMPRVLREMRAQAGELLTAMQGTLDVSMNEISMNASGFGGMRALTSAGTVVYNDNHQEQENNYHVPVVTPSETAKANREAFRRMAGGVK